jgi:gamma-glutamyltranspeptidase/glutathione hydrolase
VAVVSADDAGNTVSLIQSLFHSFGSGILDPATGIICHNRGAGFSLDPRSPNVVAGGKRPAHTLMPCTVLEEDGRVVVTGTMGASRQAQILSQVLMRVRLGAGAEEAVSAPRWVLGDLHPGEPYDELLIESRVPEAGRRSLATTGLRCRRLGAYDGSVGHAQLAIVEPDGDLTAGSDPRSEGAALVVG